MKKFIFTLMSCFFAMSLVADSPAAEDKKAAPPRHQQRMRSGFQKGHGVWMAFAELSQQERQAMLKLQREDPEKFRTEMIRRSEEFIKAEKERRNALDKLIREYRTADEKDKPAILEKIRTSVKDNFQRRLRRSRMQLEELRKRTERLEKELDRREKAEEKIVDAVVKNIIEGKHFEKSGKHPADKRIHRFGGQRPRRIPVPLQAE